MTFVFEGLLGANISLASLYFLLSLFVARQLKRLHRTTPDLNTRKLFVMTCLLSTILRTMSFASMAALDYSEVSYSVHSDTANQNDDSGSQLNFFEKATLVLFDFPDFCIISAFVLLLVVWAECFLQSRRHWLSSMAFRRVWLLGYMVFNMVLYSCQIGIYTVLFIPTIDQNLLSDLIYLSLTCFNLALPLLWMAVYIYLAMKFAGFPFISLDAKLRLSRLSLLTVLWTVTRIVWGFVALTSVVQGWLTEIKHSKLFYTLLMLILFSLTEVIPILVSLRSDLLSSLADSRAKRVGNAENTTVQAQRRIFSDDIFSDDGYNSVYSESVVGSQVDDNRVGSNVHNSHHGNRSRSGGPHDNPVTPNDTPSSTPIYYRNDDRTAAHNNSLDSFTSAQSYRSDLYSSGERDSVSEADSLIRNNQRTSWNPHGSWGAWLGF